MHFETILTMILFPISLLCFTLSIVLLRAAVIEDYDALNSAYKLGKYIERHNIEHDAAVIDFLFDGESVE